MVKRRTQYKKKQLQNNKSKGKHNKSRRVKYQKKRLNTKQKNTRQDKMIKSRKRLGHLRKTKKQKTIKTMKGGAIPFSELGNIMDNTQYMLKSFVSPFIDTAVTVSNNPQSSNINPDVTKQFLRTQSINQQMVQPNIPRHFETAFS